MICLPGISRTALFLYWNFVLRINTQVALSVPTGASGTVATGIALKSAANFMQIILNNAKDGMGEKLFFLLHCSI